MDGCQDPKCREEILLNIKDKVSYRDFNPLKTCVGTKIGRKAVWSGFIALIAVLSIVAGVWSQQKSDLPSTNRDAIADCETLQAGTRSTLDHVLKEVEQVGRNLTENQRDIKEILRHLRK